MELPGSAFLLPDDDVEVTEFDWKERNGICYDKDGVKVRHWPRSHVKDGTSAYRLAEDKPDRRFALQAVGRCTEICELDEWGERLPRTQIVAIGQGFAQELSEKLAARITPF